MEVQLAFPFIDAPEGASPVVSRYRRRLRDVSERAYRLGAMRAENRRLNEPTARSLGAAVVEQMLAPVIVTPVAGATKRPSVALSADDRNEIARLARRVAKLSIPRHDPEYVFVERDGIYRELLSISRR